MTGETISVSVVRIQDNKLYRTFSVECLRHLYCFVMYKKDVNWCANDSSNFATMLLIKF